MTERSSILTGSSEVNSAEHTRVGDLIERIGEAVEVADQRGHAARRDAELCLLSEIGRQNACSRGTAARVRRGVFREWRRSYEWRPGGVCRSIRIAIRVRQPDGGDGPPE